MKFNKDKCKVLTVHNSHKIFHIEGFNSPYSLEGFPLKTVDVEKDLGVDITPELNWEHQILRLCSKASQKLGLLRRNCGKSDLQRVRHYQQSSADHQH